MFDQIRHLDVSCLALQNSRLHRFRRDVPVRGYAHTWMDRSGITGIPHWSRANKALHGVRICEAPCVFCRSYPGQQRFPRIIPLFFVAARAGHWGTVSPISGGNEELRPLATDSSAKEPAETWVG